MNGTVIRAITGIAGCNAAKCRACLAMPVNHALAVGALIGSILDNDHVACLKATVMGYF